MTVQNHFIKKGRKGELVHCRQEECTYQNLCSQY